ncbi:hypothetical protein ACI1MP_35630 [Kitasatospora griseola]|uniref:hypothetical protein n=1 Tax=Kitasatospora griseola TaxID=2064 RepID=UPI0038558B09
MSDDQVSENIVRSTEGSDRPVRVTPISPERLVDLLAKRIHQLPGDSDRRLRVAVDGAAAARPGELADALVEPLRLLGRPVQRVSAGDFLRPASVRFEYGKQDPDAFHDLWLDEGALLREVLDPLEPGAGGRILPTFWDPATDRSTRARYLHGEQHRRGQRGVAVVGEQVREVAAGLQGARGQGDRSAAVRRVGPGQRGRPAAGALRGVGGVDAHPVGGGGLTGAVRHRHGRSPALDVAGGGHADRAARGGGRGR